MASTPASARRRDRAGAGRVAPGSCTRREAAVKSLNHDTGGSLPGSKVRAGQVAVWRRLITISAAAVRTAATAKAITIGVVELLAPEGEVPGIPATPLIGCPAAAASLATPVIAARARSLPDRPAGRRSDATASLAGPVIPCTPYPAAMTTSSGCVVWKLIS